MKRAALYIRVSTEEQALHGLSLTEQRADLMRYAEMKNYNVIDVYMDAGTSARKALSRRHELQRLLSDVRAGLIDIIIFKCLDRWFRNIKDFYKVQEILDKHKVEWECTQEEYNTTTTNGRLMLNLKLSIAQNESDSTSDRIKYINVGKIRRNETTNNKAPYGYTIIEKHFVPVPEQAAAIRCAFNHVLAGNSARSAALAIQQKLGVYLAPRNVARYLRNSLYCGRRYGKDDYCQPIISPEDFDRVQEILATRRRTAKNGRHYLFVGKIKCPGCGHPLAAHYHKHLNSIIIDYSCNYNANLAVKGYCDYSSGIYETVIEKWLLENILPLLQDYTAKITMQQADAGKIKNKIAALEEKMDRTKNMYVDGLITRDELNIRHEKLNEEIHALQRQLTRTPAATPAALEIMGADEFKALYNSMDREKKKALWQELIKEISFTRGEKWNRKSRHFFVTFN